MWIQFYLNLTPNNFTLHFFNVASQKVEDISNAPCERSADMKKGAVLMKPVDGVFMIDGFFLDPLDLSDLLSEEESEEQEEKEVEADEDEVEEVVVKKPKPEGKKPAPS